MTISKMISYIMFNYVDDGDGLACFSLSAIDLYGFL